jgi:glycosyltransferase involved in cell wall biosynthesis
MVEILLATFNGERYLASQMASLLSQDWNDFFITVSDDGSADGTLQILEDIAALSLKRVRILRNTGHKGVIGNFAFLMEQSTANHIAFCDQDDIWDSGKLSLMMIEMAKIESSCSKDTPVLLYSDMRLIDEDNHLISPSLWTKAGVFPKHANFRNLLAQNLVTGCTALANRALIQYALPIADESRVMMHDYWLALVAMAFGICQPIDKQTVSYRQHPNNVVGAGTNLTPLKRMKRIMRDTDLENWIISAAKQASFFIERFRDNLSNEDIEALEVMQNLPNRSGIGQARMMMRAGIRRTGILNQIQFLLRLAIGSRQA